MRRIKHAINSPFTDAWLPRVGKLILNFGVLECETYLWLLMLSESPVKIPDFVEWKFAKRVARIMKFVREGPCSENWKVEAQRCWNEAVEQATFRNRIAHNPLAFGWNTKAEVGEPDFIGIVNLKRRDSSQKALASKAEMDGVIDSIVSLATRLANLRTEWCSIRDEKHELRTTA